VLCFVKLSYQLPYGARGSSSSPINNHQSPIQPQYITGTESQLGNTFKNPSPNNGNSYNNGGRFPNSWKTGNSEGSGNYGGGSIVFPDNNHGKSSNQDHTHHRGQEVLNNPSSNFVPYSSTGSHGVGHGYSPSQSSNTYNSGINKGFGGNSASTGSRDIPNNFGSQSLNQRNPQHSISGADLNQNHNQRGQSQGSQNQYESPNDLNWNNQELFRNQGGFNGLNSQGNINPGHNLRPSSGYDRSNNLNSNGFPTLNNDAFEKSESFSKGHNSYSQTSANTVSLTQTSVPSYG